MHRKLAAIMLFWGLVHYPVMGQADRLFWSFQTPEMIFDTLLQKSLEKDRNGLALQEAALRTKPRYESSHQGLYLAAQGFIHLSDHKFQAAEYAFAASATQFKASGWARLRVNVMIQQSIVAEYLNAKPQAINILQEAYTICKEKGRHRRDSLLLLDILERLQVLEQSIDDNTRAYDHAFEGEALAKALKMPFFQAQFLSYLANTQMGFNEQELARKNYQAAINLLAQSTDRAEQYTCLTLRLSAAETIEELRSIIPMFEKYVKQYNLTEYEQRNFWYEYGIAIESFNDVAEALRISRMIISTARPEDSLATTYLWSMYDIHEAELSKKNYRTILNTVPNTLRKVQKSGDLYLQRLLLEELCEASYQSDEMKAAFHYLKSAIQMRDSMEATNNNRDYIRTYMTVQFEKEKELIALRQAQAQQIAETQIERQEWLLGTGGIVLTFICIAAFVLYRNFRLKKRNAEELARINAELSSQQAQLKRNIAKLHRFSGIVSHDILNNLDLILSTGNILVGAKPKPDSLVRYYEMAQQTSRQLKMYCLNLLEEARKEQADPTQTCDTMTIVHSVLARLGPALRKVGIQVTLEELSAAPLPPAVAEQVFQNLISNVLRYGATAVTPQLRIAEEESGAGNLYWVVEDNGPGIAPEQRDRIFQVSDAASEYGQGLGLSLLRAALKENGADIWVEERMGGGARFIVTMPAYYR